MLQKLYVPEISTAQGGLGVLLKPALSGAVQSSCIVAVMVASCLEAGLAPARHNRMEPPLSAASGDFYVTDREKGEGKANGWSCEGAWSVVDKSYVVEIIWVWLFQNNRWK